MFKTLYDYRRQYNCLP